MNANEAPPGGNLLAILQGRVRNNNTIAIYDAAAHCHRVRTPLFRLNDTGVSKPGATYQSRVLDTIVGNECGLYTTIHWGAPIPLDTYS